MLHRQALTFKTLPDLIQTVLEHMMQISNSLKPELSILVLLKDCATTWIQTTWCFSTILKLDSMRKEIKLEDS